MVIGPNLKHLKFLKMVGAVGFEPTSAIKRTDLQSVATLQLRRTPFLVQYQM